MTQRTRAEEPKQSEEPETGGNGVGGHVESSSAMLNRSAAASNLSGGHVESVGEPVEPSGNHVETFGGHVESFGSDVEWFGGHADSFGGHVDSFGAALNCSAVMLNRSVGERHTEAMGWLGDWVLGARRRRYRCFRPPNWRDEGTGGHIIGEGGHPSKIGGMQHSLQFWRWGWSVGGWSGYSSTLILFLAVVVASHHPFWMEALRF